MYKNLKIEINDQQPLDEVVVELERIGYVHEGNDFFDNVDNFVLTCGSGSFFYFMSDQDWGDLITLTELKNME